MKRNSNNLRKYRKCCEMVYARASGCCEVIEFGKRCGKKIPYDKVQYIHFMHKESRNGKSDEWVCDPKNIIFGCAEHHIQEHTKGVKVQGTEYDDNELTYVPDYD